MEKEVKHLSYFKVENFKCFGSFEMKDIGQFNLIVGDNNVGKTSVLEALMFTGDLSTFLGALNYIFKTKNDFIDSNSDSRKIFKSFLSKSSKIDSLKFNLNKKEFIITIKPVSDLSKLELTVLKANSLTEKIISSKTLVLTTYMNGELINVESGFVVIGDFQRIFPLKNYDYALHLLFSEIVEEFRNKENLIRGLSMLIPDLENIEISSSLIENQLSIGYRTRHFKDIAPITQQGLGVQKLLYFLLIIIYNQNRIALIDEVDSGIHYSRFKNFMKTILTSAKENNVQLFMTTHSLECMNYFKEALEELGEYYSEKARHFLLKKLDDGTTKSYSFNFAQFEQALEAGNEIRN